MQDVPTFFRNWFGHLVERVVRLDQYLFERAATAPDSRNPRPPIVDELLSKVEELSEDLLEKGRYLLSDGSVTEKRPAYYTAARSIADEFRRLHSFLTYIPAPWPSPELELFLQRVLREGRGSQSENELTAQRWTILLSGNYNFSHILVPVLATQSISPTVTAFPVLTVPGAEKDNPLMWPNLIHEIAHSVGLKEGIVHAAQHLPRVERKPPPIRKVLQQWCDEIVADLLAADYLGPA